MSNSDQSIMRATGLLILEVINSNPNGDPDRESDPRQRPDGRGEISPVSFKRKLRDLLERDEETKIKKGPVWEDLKKKFNLKDEEFEILESRGRVRAAIKEELKNGTFKNKYWDARVFGNTFLEAEASSSVKTGVVHFGLGLSVAPVEIERHTNTNKAGVQEGLDRGMAPMGYRFVPHGIYAMPFFVNPNAAHKTGCQKRDIDLLLSMIPYAYSHNRSYVRPNVEILHAWYVEHTSPLGSCSDYKLIEALNPIKIMERDKPSKSREEYKIPTELPEDLKKKIAQSKDLMDI